MKGQRVKAFMYFCVVCGRHVAAYREGERIKHREADVFVRSRGWKTRQGDWVCPGCQEQAHA